jgi:uncharacterized cupredoxin-like copper-binding protein
MTAEDRTHSIRNAVLAALVAASGAAALVGAVTAVPAGATSRTTASRTTASRTAASNITTVKAVETDFHIALSKKTFTAGRYVFVVVNKGQTTHALEITGPGLSNATTKNIQHGQTTKLTVNLKKGAYDVFCPVPGHKALGMNMNISVGAALVMTAGSGSKGASTTTTTSRNGSSGTGNGGAGF